ncbi:MAG TPA: MFS transporter [Gammaproteobacteria bacterium]|nr:MFS transporter [Gammaproteobacteria bacterium]
MNKKIIFSWCLYDVACSGFPIIITTFIFATYFTSKVAVNEIVGTYQWAMASAIAGIFVALLSPIFGAIADFSGQHKKWLLFFTLIGILGSGLLWFSYPSPHYIYFTLAAVVLGTIGLEIALVFYNAFLPHIVSQNYLGRVSGWAWGMGYFGGIIILSIALFGFVKSPPAWLDQTTIAQVRICGPLVALWLALFCIPLFYYLKETPRTEYSLMTSIQLGLKELLTTIQSLPASKNLFIYLIAHLVYIDGLNTLFAFGGIYAAGTFKMALSEVILFGIAMNIAAGIGAIIFAWVDDFIGSKPTILVSLFFLVIFGAAILLVKEATLFWIFGLALSLFFGPLQAASRSLMARIVDPAKTTEMFGLYAFSGRITAFIGPWLLGVVTLYFGSQRAGMATVLIFFTVGAILMCWVREASHNH